MAAGSAALRTSARGAGVALGLRIAMSSAHIIERMRALYLSLGLAGVVVQGPMGRVAARTLDRIVASPRGPFVNVVTNLTQRPQVDRALSVALGQGSNALAGAARQGGRMFNARLPEQLVRELERIGLATRSITNMGGRTGTEIRFEAAASRWIVPFFTP